MEILMLKGLTLEGTQNVKNDFNVHFLLFWCLWMKLQNKWKALFERRSEKGRYREMP